MNFGITCITDTHNNSVLLNLLYIFSTVGLLHLPELVSTVSGFPLCQLLGSQN